MTSSEATDTRVVVHVAGPVEPVGQLERLQMQCCLRCDLLMRADKPWFAVGTNVAVDQEEWIPVSPVRATWPDGAERCTP